MTEMNHVFKQGDVSNPTFVVLHGTGGNEHDLFPVAEYLNPTYSVLGVRGNISENGMNRFFKRHGEGQYDVEDLMYRTQELHEFLEKASQQYHFKLDDVILVGFSNGSNIAINLMLDPTMPYRKGLLFAPLYPLSVDDNLDLSDQTVFLSMGKNDPMVTRAQSDYVQSIFADHGAHVTTHWVNSHEITREALEAAKASL